jgi:hypothetical protein
MYINFKDGINDKAIGNRTISDPLTVGANISDSLTNLLEKLSQAILAIEKASIETVYLSETYLTFPNIGNKLILYLDTSSNKVYRWDDNNLKYYVIGSNYEDIKVINGGNANG